MIKTLISTAASTVLFFGQLSAQITNSDVSKYLEEYGNELNLSTQDGNDVRIVSAHASNKFDAEYAYVQQFHANVPVHNAIMNFVKAGDRFVMSGNRFQSDLVSRINTEQPSIQPKDAVLNALTQLGIAVSPNELQLTDTEHGITTFSYDSELSSPIPVRLMYQPTDNGEVRLAYDLNLDLRSGKHWWSVRVDAVTGFIIDQVDWVISCSFEGDHQSHAHGLHAAQSSMMMPPPPSTDQYTVYALPLESPNHGPRTTVVGPADATASPFGWHDIDGSNGEEYTITRGNNVYATEDIDDNNNPGYSPDGGPSLNFDFPLDFNTPNVDQLDGVITNLFYMNNVIHDILYHYGFEETAGNFQENNYGNGGTGSDYVNAEAQDGSGTNNANFSTPPDGGNPRMQMYLWGTVGTPQTVQVNNGPLAGTYTGVEALLGPGLSAAPVTADLILFDDGTGDPNDGCEAALNAGALNGNIAIIRRGSCTFADKIMAAQNLGAIGVIIVNNQGGAAVAMGGTDPGISIPAVMMMQSEGEALIAEIVNGGSMNVTIDNFGPFNLDSALDNGIIAHEYGHGVSNRLTGGAPQADCLWNEEQMGEGWSDYLALIFTMEPGDTRELARGMATYANGDPTFGPGIRPAPYSTNWQVNNYTYTSTNNTNLSEPHGIGFVWCTMLWEMTWDLIELYGWDPDLYNGTGGNNIALQLVMEGMKLQPCNPGFVDGRDAILLADELLYNSAHECIIWEAFARRGLGYYADQGSSFDRSDQVASFDLPPMIDHVYDITACASYTWPENGQTYTNSGTYTTLITPNMVCDTVATLNLTITNNINTNVVYADGVTLEATTVVPDYQWITCSDDQPIPGETNSTFTATQNGVYAVILSDGQCTDTSVCLLINSANVDEVSGLIDVVLYPNPTEELINFDIDKSNFNTMDVVVYDVIGKRISTRSFTSSEELTMSLNGAQGVYLVEVIIDDNYVQTFRVRKE
jgi:hypothetical protein